MDSQIYQYQVSGNFFAFSSTFLKFIFLMKTSLKLPLESRQGSVPRIPSIEELDPVVECAPVRSPEGVSPIDGSEREINKNINRASLNAEMNRKISYDCAHSNEEDHCSTISARPRLSSVTFGNESEIEYESNTTPSQARTVVRNSKEFDGNRSGRLSTKN